MLGKKRQVSQRSLENLKLGAEARRQDKQRHNFTLLPETIEWLKQSSNASGLIDRLVKSAKAGHIYPDNTHDGNGKELTISNDVYEKIEQLEKENEQLRSDLQKLKAVEKDLMDQLCNCHSDAFKAADILKAALKLAANAGGKIKREIEKALPLIDDV